jgi:cob(I)alamin adenosyltransferase
MKIYTKQGDAGETGLYGGSRVPKDHLRIQAYGTLDELNAALGLVLSLKSEPPIAIGERGRLERVQGELFQLGAELATPPGKNAGIALVGDAETTHLETEIDGWDALLPPLKTFILPGGTAAAALLHQARTISRRAEREIVTLGRAEPVRPEAIRYMNRLSDWLFVAARLMNHEARMADVPWAPRKA